MMGQQRQCCNLAVDDELLATKQNKCNDLQGQEQGLGNKARTSITGKPRVVVDRGWGDCDVANRTALHGGYIQSSSNPGISGSKIQANNYLRFQKVIKNDYTRGGISFS